MAQNEPDIEFDRDEIVVPPDGQAHETQPQWRQDFPINRPQDNYVARRDFTKFMALTSLAFVAGQFWIVVQSFLRKRRAALAKLEIAKVNEIPIGGSKIFNYPKPEHDGCVIVRLEQDKFVAYSQKCTHLSCAVIPDTKEGCLVCPCHEGRFDLATGRPIAGPPRRPLPVIDLEIKDGAIYATNIEVKIQ